ncbi:MAG: hypothetical protein U0793_10970 [Gemmataceae bacterium]
MRVELLGDFEDVVSGIVVVDEDEIQLAAGGLVVEGPGVAEVGEEVTVAGDVGMEAAQVADQGAGAFGVFRVELAHLGVEQLLEVGGSACSLLGGR